MYLLINKMKLSQMEKQMILINKIEMEMNKIRSNFAKATSQLKYKTYNELLNIRYGNYTFELIHDKNNIDILLSEKFKPINNYETRYEISSTGIVRNIRDGYILKNRIRKGYYIVTLFDGWENKDKTFSIHRLVAEAFLKNPDNKPNVNHIDGNKLNNDFKNLRYISNNEKKLTETTSGIKGVCFYKSKNRWRATIYQGGKSIHIGYFEKLEDAKEARRLEEKELLESI